MKKNDMYIFFCSSISIFFFCINDLWKQGLSNCGENAGPGTKDPLALPQGRPWIFTYVVGLKYKYVFFII
jgi:hypothetical protein